MFLTFRWYGDGDPVSLAAIRQIPGMRGVVSALYDLDPGVPWPLDRLRFLRAEIEAAGLEFSAIESVPVHEHIKLGLPGRDAHIEAWIASIRAAGEAGVPVVIYNFMPVFDWTRTTLAKRNPDGSTSLAYDEAELARMDPLSGELALPGWIGKYRKEELAYLVGEWRASDVGRLRDAFAYFIRAVAPAAEKAGVRLALHPDDPPWPVFGIPRMASGAEGLRAVLACDPSPANGLCFCSGSLAADPRNDVVAMASEFASRIAFAHLRNVKVNGPGRFEECAHWSGAGSIDQWALVRALVRGGYSGPVRPDHGRQIWGEGGKAGYGLFDRALGSQYLLGLIEAAARGEA